MYQALPLHFSVGSKVIRNNCAKEGEPGDEATRAHTCGQRRKGARGQCILSIYPIFKLALVRPYSTGYYPRMLGEGLRHAINILGQQPERARSAAHARGSSVGQ